MVVTCPQPSPSPTAGVEAGHMGGRLPGILWGGLAGTRRAPSVVPSLRYHQVEHGSNGGHVIRDISERDGHMTR